MLPLRNEVLRLFALATLGACAGAQASSPAPNASEDDASRPNIVLVILDDVGVDKIGAYGEAPAGTLSPRTPCIDGLASEGMLFLHCWANPVCSPTRAQMLTGRHGFRTGIGTILDFEGSLTGLSTAETTLPEVLIPGGYDTSAVGKWHLGPANAEGLRHPLESGFRFYAGSLFNIATPPIDCGPDCARPDCSSGGRLGYYNWVKVATDPKTGLARQTCVTTYATTDTADDAIARAQAMQAPWFLQVSFNAAHQPAQPPPPELVPEPPPDDDMEGVAQRFLVINSMIEALDHEVGRTVAGIRAVDPSALIFVIGDNGTSVPGAQGEVEGCFGPRRSKGSVYEGGIRVPLIAAGPGVVRGRCEALVGATDLFATVAELAGVTHPAPDSVSMLPYLAGDPTPRRETVYAETFKPNFPSLDAPGSPAFEPSLHLRALRNARFKLIRTTVRRGTPKESTTDELFDLEMDPCEANDLCRDARSGEARELGEEQRANLDALRAELVRLGVYD